MFILRSKSLLEDSQSPELLKCLFILAQGCFRRNDPEISRYLSSAFTSPAFSDSTLKTSFQELFISYRHQFSSSSTIISLCEPAHCEHLFPSELRAALKHSDECYIKDIIDDARSIFSKDFERLSYLEMISIWIELCGISPDFERLKSKMQTLSPNSALCQTLAATLLVLLEAECNRGQDPLSTKAVCLNFQSLVSTACQCIHQLEKDHDDYMNRFRCFFVEGAVWISFKDMLFLKGFYVQYTQVLEDLTKIFSASFSSKLWLHLTTLEQKEHMVQKRVKEMGIAESDTLIEAFGLEPLSRASALTSIISTYFRTLFELENLLSSCHLLKSIVLLQKRLECLHSLRKCGFFTLWTYERSLMKTYLCLGHLFLLIGDYVKSAYFLSKGAEFSFVSGFSVYSVKCMDLLCLVRSSAGFKTICSCLLNLHGTSLYKHLLPLRNITDSGCVLYLEKITLAVCSNKDSLCPKTTELLSRLHLCIQNGSSLSLGLGFLSRNSTNHSNACMLPLEISYVDARVTLLRTELDGSPDNESLKSDLCSQLESLSLNEKTRNALDGFACVSVYFDNQCDRLILSRSSSFDSKTTISFETKGGISNSFKMFKRLVDSLMTNIHLDATTLSQEAKTEVLKQRLQLDREIGELLKDFEEQFLQSHILLFQGSLVHACYSEVLCTLEKHLSDLYLEFTGELETAMLCLVIHATSSKEILFEALSQYGSLQKKTRVTKALKILLPCVKNLQFPSTTSPFCLVLDDSLHFFPWESLPSLQRSAISRIPSFSFLKMLNNSKRCSGQIMVNRVSCILNPSQDCSGSEDSVLRSLPKKCQVSSIQRRYPSSEEFESELSNSDLFIYAGHNGGQQYFRASQVEKLNVSSPCLLFGCSSAKLVTYGIFYAQGLVYAYLLAGSPAVVGNLWDVTNGDMNRLSSKLLRDWFSKGSKNENYTLLHALRDSRKECKLRYANGASAVCYGIPIRAILPSRR